MNDRPRCEIRLDAQVNNAILLKEAQHVLAANPIESIIVRFNHRQAFDFGAWCFRTRFGGRAWKNVDISTLLPKRLLKLQSLASHVITTCLTKKALSSGYGSALDWVTMANWCEANGHDDFLNSPEIYNEALFKFSEYLNSDHREYVTRQRIQSVCKTFGEYMFPEENYRFIKLPTIERPNHKKTEAPQPPSEAAIAHHLRTCEPLFVGLTDLLTNHTKLPCKLKINERYAWVMPDKKYPLITDDILANNGTYSGASVTIDYREGRMRTFEEFQARSSSGDIYQHAQAIRAYEKRLSEANSTQDNEYRIRLGRIAHDSFVALFVANTGINESPLRELPWDPKYQIIKDDEVGMRTIKFRAQNKIITVRVKASFIKHFKKFVKLRNYLCDGIDHRYLFIGFNDNCKCNYRIMDTNILRRLYDSLRRLVDPSMPCLSYQAFRDYKDNYTAKKHGHEASRVILGHTEKTQRKSYLKSSEHSAVDQIGKFNAVVNDFFGKPHPCSTPVGGCSGEGMPQKKAPLQTSSEPNCKNETGCLNCIHHKVHANHEDAWKLLSLEYVTKQMIHASSDIKHFELIHGPTLKSIDGLLDQMLTANPSLAAPLEELRADVYQNNNLTLYWQRHLERLVRLKVIL